MIPSWSWKTKVIHGTEHFSSLMDICMNSPGCLLEADSFILPWDLSSVNWFHVLCIASSMISLFLNFWKKWSIFKWWDPYPTYPVRKTRSYSDGNFSCPPSLTADQLAPASSSYGKGEMREARCVWWGEQLLWVVFKNQGSFRGLLLVCQKAFGTTSCCRLVPPAGFLCTAFQLRTLNGLQGR